MVQLGGVLHDRQAAGLLWCFLLCCAASGLGVRCSVRRQMICGHDAHDCAIYHFTYSPSVYYLSVLLEISETSISIDMVSFPLHFLGCLFIEETQRGEAGRGN